MDSALITLLVAVVCALAAGVALGYALKSRTIGKAAGEDPLALRAQLDLVQQQYNDLRLSNEAENKVLQALAPVSERLSDMQRTVQELEKQRNEQHGQISQQLRAAVASDELLRGTAEQLASALRSNSVRGVWGEVQLRRVVEAAGLIE
ncbi:MAG: DNA recombination protein RmuC, partial [Microbacteriaceae bacterium]|nr:DNA recombination protein RmuC [Microbacteriaceae bacterium]